MKTKRVLVRHLNIDVTMRSGETEALTEERQVLASLCVCACVCRRVCVP